MNAFLSVKRAKPSRVFLRDKNRTAFWLFVVGAACLGQVALAHEVWDNGNLSLYGDTDGTIYMRVLSPENPFSVETPSSVKVGTEKGGATLILLNTNLAVSGEFYVGYQALPGYTNMKSLLALTNATLTVGGKCNLGCDATGEQTGGSTMILGSNSAVSAERYYANGEPNPEIYFQDGRLISRGSECVFQLCGWSCTGSYPNPHVYLKGDLGPIDIEIPEGKTPVLAYDNAGRGLYLQGSHGFIKRGKGTLIWEWRPGSGSNAGSLNGEPTYTGDTVVEEGGIRLGDSCVRYHDIWRSDQWIPAAHTYRNPMPTQSPLVLKANAFFDVNTNVSTWCSIAGAGIVTNSATDGLFGRLVFGGNVADGELSPSSIGGRVDVCKIGTGTLSVNTPKLDGTLIISNGTVRIARGSTFDVRRIVVLPDATLDARGATLTDVTIEVDGHGATFGTVSDAYVSGSTITFGGEGGNATLTDDLGVGLTLVKEGSGSLTLNAAAHQGNLTVKGGSVVYGTIPLLRAYRHFRFKIDALYHPDKAEAMQISEFRLKNGDTDISAQRSGVAYVPYTTSSANENVDMCYDGNLNTKWCDQRGSYKTIATRGDELYIQFDYAQPTYVTSYSWATANDAAPSTGVCRDPAAWRLLVSDDGCEWVALDSRTDMGPYAAREAWVGDFDVTACYPAERYYDTTRTFGTVTVEEGATLDVRGAPVITFGALVNNGGTVLTDASTQILLSAPEGQEVVTVGGSSSLAVDVVKVGAGTNTFHDAWALDGNLAISNGTVRCRVSGFSGKFFRVSISKHADMSEPRTQFAEFYLYDKAGNQIDDGRPYARAAIGTATNGNASALQPGYACTPVKYVSYATTEDIEKAFDGAVFSGSTCTKFLVGTLPSEEEPIVFYFRMPEDTPRVYGYNYVAGNDDYDKRNPVSWKVEGSHDGVTWYLLDQQTDAETYSGNSTAANPVYYNGGVPYGVVGAGGPDADDAHPFGEQAVVSVAQGATLAFDSPLMQLDRLAIDVTEVMGGTIERFTPAVSGRLDVRATAAQLASEAPLPLFTVGTVNDASNLRRWSVYVNGEANANYRLRWRDGQLQLGRVTGLRILVR